jgi:glucokinase
MTVRLLAFDFGGTKLAAARIDVTDVGAELVAVGRAATPPDAEGSRAAMWELASEVMGSSHIDAAGVSFGGLVDMARGVVLTSQHIVGWRGYQLAEAVSSRYDAPCALLNDANAGALGEQRWGAARGLADVVYVTVSTGVGAGIVLGGRLHAGTHALAGELGHLPVSEDGPMCSCGRRGCLEALASGPAIARAMRDALRVPSAAAPGAGVDPDVAGLDARMVAQAAQRGDEVALAVLSRAGRALGVGLAAAVLLVDPAAIVLDGGVVNSGEPLLEPARAVLRERVFGKPPQLLMSALAPHAPLYGAAAAAADLLADRTHV